MKHIAKKLIPIGTFKAVAPYWHWSKSVFYQTKAGFPAKNLTVIGVTGTDGKTSTSTLITQMLRNSGKKVAMMTTISVDYGDGKGAIANPTRLTTFGADHLVSALKKMQDSSVEYLVLEVTSHALHQKRIWGVPISIAVMTNIGHEHLDYHGTFENYREAKKQLFILANKNKKGLRTGVINADDDSAELFANSIANPVTYGQNNADMQAENVSLTPGGSSYSVTIPQKLDPAEAKLNITCNLPGSFNVYNSLAASTVGLCLGLTSRQVEEGIASLREVEGRMTKVDLGQEYAVIVDYAHTPESFDKIFAEVKPLTKGRLICVFGSAGRRDEQKRYKQGEIAGKWCDIVIVTEEDDRDIDGEEIMRQIVEGAERSGKILNKDVLMIHNREEAVQTAINTAKPGDLVILLGKGHEKSILTNGPQAAEFRHLPQDDDDTRRVTKRSYDEVQVAQDAIKNKQL